MDRAGGGRVVVARQDLVAEGAVIVARDVPQRIGKLGDAVQPIVSRLIDGRLQRPRAVGIGQRRFDLAVERVIVERGDAAERILVAEQARRRIVTVER
jgi:hypothetical protein